MPERGADRLGNDPAEAYRASAASLQAALARPGVLERSACRATGERDCCRAVAHPGSTICSLGLNLT